jgi:hypothetical protein
MTAPSPIQSVRENARRGRFKPCGHAGHVTCSTTADLLEDDYRVRGLSAGIGRGDRAREPRRRRGAAEPPKALL